MEDMQTRLAKKHFKLYEKALKNNDDEAREYHEKKFIGHQRQVKNYEE